MQNTFEIQVDLNSDGTQVPVTVTHSDESFDILTQDKKEASIINNGDNTWQLISGNLSQETVNLIGDQIEKFYNNADPLG